MGLLKKFFGAIKRGVKKVVGKLNDWLNGTSRSAESVSDSVSSHDAYDPETATVSETEALSAALSSMSLGCRGDAAEIEEKIVDAVEEYFDKIIEDLEENGFDTRFIKNEVKDIKKKVRHSITDNLSARLTLTDPDCRRILELKSGSYKKKKMKNFCFEVINESVDELSHKLKDSFDDIQSKIKSAVDSKLEESEERLDNEKKRVDALISQHDSQTFDIEKNSVQPYENICACICVSDILDSAN